MLAELKKGLGVKRKCLCSKTTSVLLEGTVQKMYDVGLLHIYCIINKYAVEKCMYTVYKRIYYTHAHTHTHTHYIHHFH